MVELVYDVKASLGESPVWDYRNKTLYYVDYLEGRIYYHLPYSEIKNGFYQLDVKPGSIAPMEDGNILVAYGSNFGVFNRKTCSLTIKGAPEEGIKTNHFNDGKCDAKGRFWVGSITEGEKEAHSALYCINNDFTFEKVLSNVTTSNGLT